MSVARARRLRRFSTKPEVILWRELRNRQPGGFKFRRQVPVGPYVADFLCYEQRLLVEVDGEGHDRARDAKRDAWFRANGFTTLRIPADAVGDDLEGVMVAVGRALGLAWSV